MAEPVKGPGYHLADIQKGTLGELSKIQEELDEAKDAQAQDCKIMELVELSDLVGALQHYLDKHHAGYTIGDLAKMAQITGRAFNSGRRS
jgi:hypothetical protein